MRLINSDVKLQWAGRDEAINQARTPRYHSLKKDIGFSYGDPSSSNMLIQGDNLEVLKALLPDYAGKIKCIFIDPPYNTKRDFGHYDDNLQHAKWLEMMYPRLELLHELLDENGSIWVTIDDKESHYLKIIMDEIFGRNNFIADCAWQRKYGVSNNTRYIAHMHDSVLCFAKNKKLWRANLLPRSEELDSQYKNMDEDIRGIWRAENLSVRRHSKKNDYIITTPKGIDFRPPKRCAWRVSKEKYEELLKGNRIWFGKNGTSTPRQKKFLSEVQQGVVPTTLWLSQDTGSNPQATFEMQKLFEDQGSLFSTPKPEKLIQRILALATNENDIILDSFLGSGTTAAVAHKMGRHYIGIEMGEHAKAYCVTRLQKIIDGEQGGISKDVNWQGGGGFHFYTLDVKSC